MKEEVNVAVLNLIGGILNKGLDSVLSIEKIEEIMRSHPDNLDALLRGLNNTLRKECLSKSALNDAYQQRFPFFTGLRAEEFSTIEMLLSTIMDASHRQRSSFEKAAFFFNKNPLAVANYLCGSVFQYKYPSGEIVSAAFSRISAWETVGGDDQTFPQAKPGTIGYWSRGRSKGIGVISAHEEGKTGIVAIWGIIPLNQKGEPEKEITHKSEIYEKYGFSDPRVLGKLINQESVPFQLDFSKGLIQIKGNYSVVNMNPETTHEGLRGAYQLVKGRLRK